MKDPVEIKGYWWLPDDPEKKLSGTLNFSQENGILLELIGNFEMTQSARREQPGIILGITQGGNQITLYKCINIGLTYPITGLGGSKYAAHFIFDGVHFNNEADVKFDQLFGNYTDLDAWVNINGFKVEQETINKKIISKITYEKPSPHIFEIGDTFEVGINFSSRGPNWTIVQSEVSISQKTYLFVKSKTGDISIESLFSQLNKFCALFQLGVQRLPYPVEIYGFSENNREDRENSEPYYPKINIYYKPIEGIILQRSLLPQEMLYTLKDLAPNQINIWFSLFDKYRPIINLYRSNYFKDRMFIETKFLNITQALESLHSILFENQYLSKKEFTDRKKMVIEVIPEALSEWVEDALSNANYKRLWLKINELLTGKTHLFSELIHDFDKFAKQVKDTRNQFVHNNKQKLAFQSSEEILSATELMTILLEAYILEIIGFSTEKANELLKPKIRSRLTGWRQVREN